MTHTPGPWEFRTLKNGWALFPSAAPKNWSLENVICGGEGDYDHLWDKEPDEANARLIAAAPELYEALRMCLLNGNLEEQERDMGLAALAKATSSTRGRGAAEKAAPEASA